MKVCSKMMVLALLFAALPLAAQETAPCSLHNMFHDAGVDLRAAGRGLVQAPRNSVRPQNLLWEAPIGVAGAVLIKKADTETDDRIQSLSVQSKAQHWTNNGMAMEMGAGFLSWGVGCATHHPRAAETGFTALTAMGTAGAIDLGLKLAFDRQFPVALGHSTGNFRGGGRSFPSGHSATSWAFAAVVAHRYPNKKWVKWGAYALAAGVSMGRVPAKRHFPSDVLIGSTIGYLTGTYIADHTAH